MQIGIVGTGLIGASIGLCLKAQGYEVVGCDTNKDHLATAIRRTAIDRGADLAEIAKLDVVFLCISPSILIPVAEELYTNRGELTIFTDCGSTKTEVAAWAADKPMFVPGHPMAGHEKSGPSYATNWLFRGAKWILTPSKKTDKHAISVVQDLVKKMEATPVSIDPATHDRQVGVLSHLPHVVAALLIEARNSLPLEKVSGGSWKDLTRVAGVDPNLWTDILMSNRQELDGILGEYEANIHKIRDMLSANDREALQGFLQHIVVSKERQNES